jgi:hypothetical protein
VTVENVSVSTATATSSFTGGAVALTSSSARPFIVTNSSFSSCKCNTDSGKGGAFYLSLTDESEQTFDVTFLKFDGNEAAVGSDIFLFLFLFDSYLFFNCVEK